MTDLPLWLDGLLAALVATGATFALIGSWDLARLSDFLKRLHGPTKATTLGVALLHEGSTTSASGASTIRFMRKNTVDLSAFSFFERPLDSPCRPIG